MKEKQDNKADVGVIVGRFQVNELHAAHMELIKSVVEKHDRVIIFLGLSPLRNTRNNPLDFKPRKVMIEQAFPTVEVFYVDDVPSDELWSKNIDAQIRKWLQPSQTVRLYGSRDSFIKHYTGTFKTVELESSVFVSGTEIRAKIVNQSAATKDFRAGMIYASGSRYPSAIPTVDVAVLSEDRQKVLLGRKPNEDKYRFIGGFVDPKLDKNFADAAIRELHEEAGPDLNVSKPVYIGSTIVDDWRYRNEQDKIFTTLFVVTHLWGTPQPNDDIEELRWFNFNEICGANQRVQWIMPVHIPLLNMLGDYTNTNR